MGAGTRDLGRGDLLGYGLWGSRRPRRRKAIGPESYLSGIFDLSPPSVQVLFNPTCRFGKDGPVQAGEEASKRRLTPRNAPFRDP